MYAASTTAFCLHRTHALQYSLSSHCKLWKHQQIHLYNHYYVSSYGYLVFSKSTLRVTYELGRHNGALAKGICSILAEYGFLEQKFPLLACVDLANWHYKLRDIYHLCHSTFRLSPNNMEKQQFDHPTVPPPPSSAKRTVRAILSAALFTGACAYFLSSAVDLGLPQVQQTTYRHLYVFQSP